MVDRLDQFLQDSQKLVGLEAIDVPQGAEVADWLTIRRFCAALGDTNPLYKDPTSGVSTKYNSMIAPPTFVSAIRTPTSRAAYVNKDYGLINLLTHGAFEWVDIIRVGDRLKSQLKLVSANAGSSIDDRRCAKITSKATYWNSYGGLIGTASGTSSMLPFRPGEKMILERDIYQYSDEEIATIAEALESEIPPRGKLLRYWDEVNIGDKLPGLVKGPLNLADMMAWSVAEQKPLALGPPVYFNLKSMPGRIRTNPTTNWPFWDADQESDDILSCKNSGFVAPFGRGMQRMCLAAQVLTHWMGDDGFLRSLDIDLPNHYIYGDTMWLQGEVTTKYTAKVDNETYFAVEVQVRGTNQLGETIVHGNATVYLPSPGHPVTLPIPH